MPEREKAGRKAIEEVQRLRARVANLERIALRKAGPKDADRELDRAWSEWETTFDAIGDSVILLDSEFNILQANAATSSLLGKPLDEVVGQRCCKLVHGSNEPLENCPLIKAKTTKKRQKAELYIAEKGIWALVSVDPILDELGNLTGAVHIIRDITERKRAEEGLKRQNELLNAIINSIKDIIIVALDRDYRYIAFNEKHRQEMKKVYNADIELAQCMLDYISVPEVRPIAKASYDRVLKGESFTEIQKQPNLDIWYEFFWSPIRTTEGQISGITIFIRDITERKKAEEALQKSVRLLRDTGEMAKVGGWELDLSTNEVSWTEEVGRIHGVEPGYKPKLEEALNFYAPESRPAVEAVVKKAAETGEPYDLESLFIPLGSKDTIWVRSLGKAVYSGDKIVKLAGTFQNIDKYKRAEEKIESLAKFPAENPYPVLRITKDGEILYSNEAGKLLLMHWNSKVGKTVPEKWRSSITEAFRSKKTKTEEEKVEDRIFSCVIAPVKDAGYVNLYGRDVTERKKAEQQVRQSEQKYKELFESAREAIIIMDLNGKITDANRIVEEYGHTRDYLLGKSIFDFIPVNHRARAARDFDELCHGTPVKGAMEVIGPKGNLMVEYRDNPIVREGQVVAVQAILMDITEQKRAEQALRDYQARLKLLAAELALAEERERHRIAAGIHDGIGQKLALAKMELQLLARSPGKSKIPASLDGVCARIDEAIKDAHSLTFELSNPALYDLSFKAAIDLWLLEKIQKKHGIKCTVIAGEQAVPLDENSKVVLFRALRELAVNVVKHAKATVLTVTVEKLENSVQITCKDDGLGFTPPEEGALPRDVGGFGLFNIKERLEYLGGSMKLQSAPGRGTLVTLSLPAAAAKPLKQQNNADVDEGRQ